MDRDRQLHFELIRLAKLRDTLPNKIDRAILIMVIDMGLEDSKFRASLSRECDIYELEKDYGILN
jgi:hypothetical protein